MSNGEDGTKKDTHATDDYVGDAKEGVSASHDGASRDDNRLGALVDVGGELWKAKRVSVNFTLRGYIGWR